jgi:hypothetical protein
VSPKLTLNLGLRWDLFTPYNETRGYQSNFSCGRQRSHRKLLHPQPDLPTRGPHLQYRGRPQQYQHRVLCKRRTRQRSKDNFAPRVGFAYKLRPTLVVRGGFGTAYGALGNLGYGGTLGLNYPFGYVQTVPAPDSNHPLLPAPGQAATMENGLHGLQFPESDRAAKPDPVHNDAGYLPVRQLLRWRSIHRQRLSGPSLRCPPEQLPDAAGTDGEPDRRGSVHEPRRDPGGICRHPGPSPGYSGEHERNSEILPSGTNTHSIFRTRTSARNSTYETTNANSSYNSMQVTYQHQMSFGLSLLANYTWSKCLSDQHAPQNSQFNAGYRAQWLPGFGIKGDYALCDGDATDLCPHGRNVQPALRPWHASSAPQ